MNPDDRNPDLERLFAEARAREEASAPDLDGLLARPRSARRVATPARRASLALAAVLVLGATALLVRGRVRSAGPGRGGPEPPAETLMAWRSPTASLLRTPGAELLGGVPALVPRAPVFSTAALPQTTKGAVR